MKRHYLNAERLRARGVKLDERSVRFVEAWCYCTACRKRRAVAHRYVVYAGDSIKGHRVTRPQLRRIEAANPGVFDAIAEVGR